MSTSNEENTAQDAIAGLSNATPEAPTENTDDGEHKTMSTTKDRAQNDPNLECCICLENLPKDTTKFNRSCNRLTCCGQGMHNYCANDWTSMKMSKSCPMCRAKTPTSDEEHVKYLRPWVKKKKVWALTMMAHRYYTGNGVKQSYAMAKRLFEQASQQGNVAAMTDLGVMYCKGQGIEQSYESAVKYYEQAAQLGHADAQFNLGLMYERGTGVTRSNKKAKEYWELAVEQGNPQAMSCLGGLYANGDGVERNVTKARELFTNAAEQGHQGAIKYLKQLDDVEIRAAVLDPHAIVCSSCGLPQTSTRSFNKFKCPCKSTRYCNTTCQKKHWKEHRTDCKRLIAELKRTKKLKAAEEEHT
jgi:hypothetical protein